MFIFASSLEAQKRNLSLFVQNYSDFMRVRHIETPLPTKWVDGLPHLKCALGVFDIKITHGSRLRMKLLVFKTKRDMRRFWRKSLGRKDLSSGTSGCVSPLAHERIYTSGPLKGQKFMMVDPRYFCVMGLVMGYLTVEIISHESGHAAFAYSKRVHCRDMWVGLRDHEEERVCYPLGVISQRVADALKDNGLLDHQQEMLERRNSRRKK